MLSAGLDQAILPLLAAGQTRSESIAAALGVPVRTVQRRLGRLRARGFVESRSRGTWRLTGAGQRAALTATVPEPVGALNALEALPGEHRAVLRLVEDAVVARRALEAVHPTNWPGFVLLGPTKTGKTLLGSLAARRFGLQPTEVIRLLMMETPGSLLGRRVQDGAEAWRTVPSPPLGLPLVVLDEYDKASPELRQAAFTYLAGASSYLVEGMTLEVHATAIVTLNDDGALARLLPDSYLRRSVVLDTSALVDATADLDETARVLARASLPRIAAALAPPAAELPEAARALLRSVLRACLTDRGWGLVDVEAIARLALGRWAQEPADPGAAAIAVAADYLLVTATRPGLVQDGWAARFDAAAGRPGGPIAAALASARARQATAQGRQVAAERAALDASLELAGTRERLRDALDHALRTAPRGRELTTGERATIAAARGKARPLRAAIAGARSLDALGALEAALEREILAPLRTVTAALEGRRAAAEQARRSEVDARRRSAERARADRAAVQAAHRAAKSRHAELQRLYRRASTSPGEDVGGELLAARCLTQRSEQYEEETLRSMVGRGIRSLLGSASPPPAPAPDPWGPYLARRQPSPPVPSGPEPRYVTKTRTWYEDRSGRPYGAGDLVAWGSEPVRMVLEAAAAAEGLARLSLPKRRAGTSGVRPAARRAGRSTPASRPAPRPRSVGGR